jgi:hypothetical protein
LWLHGITRTGHVTTAGGVAVTDPEITFDPGADPLPNRVDGPSDGHTSLARWRIQTVHTESGGDLIVSYSGPDCTRTTLPTPHTNTKRCMPAFWAPEGTGDPTLDWFHKYVVTRIDLDDAVTDQLNTTTFYDYLDAPAWHYQDDEITKDKFKTWGDWRGYSRVQVPPGRPVRTADRGGVPLPARHGRRPSALGHPDGVDLRQLGRLHHRPRGAAGIPPPGDHP